MAAHLSLCEGLSYPQQGWYLPSNVHDKTLNIVGQRYLREPLKILKRGCSLNPNQENKQGFEVEGVTGR